MTRPSIIPILHCVAASARRCRLLLVFALALLPLAGTPALSFWDETDDNVLLDRLLEEMPAEEVISQLFMVGWTGETPSNEIRSWISERNIGGVKIFGWNGGDLPALAQSIGTMQKLAADHAFSVPLLTATDQEGGWVRHIKGNDALSTSVTPGNMAIAASGLPYDAYRSAYYIGLELRALGVNMDFAPTVDVYVNPLAAVIGPRAFSDDPIVSGILAVAFFHGLETARVIATAKHFPGHGNASGDSHGMLPVISDDLSVIWDRDLVPYRFLIPEGLPAILTGHLSFPNVAGDGRPASLSRYMEQTLLRRRLGFDGLIMTDDLYMGGAWQYGAGRNWGIADIVVEAIRAGNDMVMLSRTPDLNGEIWNAIYDAYQTDGSFQERVRDAARTVLSVKLRYLKNDDRVPLIPDTALLPRKIQTPEGNTYFRDQAGRSVTLIRARNIPHPADDDERVLLAGKDPDFLRVGAEFYPNADQLQIASPAFDSATESDKQRFRDAIPNYDTVIFCLSDPNTLEVLQEAADVPTRIIVVSSLTPIYLLETPWVESAIAVYGWGDESFRAGFSVLIGKMDAEGSLPIRLDHPAAIPGETR